MNVIFILLFLVLINWLAKLVLPNSALSPSELLTIYIILAASSNISGYDSMVALMGVIPHAFWYNTLENDWASLFHKDIPEWLVVSDRKIIRGFYSGEATFFTEANIRNWAIPALSWSAFIILLVIIMLLINVIIRKQWTEREKLTYPIIQLPIEMTNPRTQLFRNRLMWYCCRHVSACFLREGWYDSLGFHSLLRSLLRYVVSYNAYPNRARYTRACLLCRYSSGVHDHDNRNPSIWEPQSDFTGHVHLVQPAQSQQSNAAPTGRPQNLRKSRDKQ